MRMAEYTRAGGKLRRCRRDWSTRRASEPPSGQPPTDPRDRDAEVAEPIMFGEVVHRNARWPGRGDDCQAFALSGRLDRRSADPPSESATAMMDTVRLHASRS